ncbi:hypothetical protein DY000_02004315 [Brassica cretica]|uniref:Uncharacterized protein n=1 Tax=Brassica cretica TaxID=69181 RepID=A0ABQ7BU30_BRACR|nr:hypothetical protein DY000_02004315 [Brassica cretica]
MPITLLPGYDTLVFGPYDMTGAFPRTAVRPDDPIQDRGHDTTSTISLLCLGVPFLSRDDSASPSTQRLSTATSLSVLWLSSTTHRLWRSLSRPRCLSPSPTRLCRGLSVSPDLSSKINLSTATSTSVLWLSSTTHHDSLDGDISLRPVALLDDSSSLALSIEASASLSVSYLIVLCISFDLSSKRILSTVTSLPVPWLSSTKSNREDGSRDMKVREGRGLCLTIQDSGLN